MAKDRRRLITALAQSMLARTVFPQDAVSPETIWRAQLPAVRATWRDRAGQVIEDLHDDGFTIEEW
jgi:hypothetical protein